MLASTGDESSRDKLGDGQLPNFSPRRDSKAVCAALNVYDKYAKKCSKAGRKGGCESCRNTDLDPPTPIMAPIVLPSGPNIEPTSRQCNCIPGPTTTFAPEAFLNGPPGGSTKDKYYGQMQRLFNSKPSSCRSPNPPILENDYTQ